MDKKTFNRLIPYDSLYSFVANFNEEKNYKSYFDNVKNQPFVKQEAREIFLFVQKNCYKLFKEFYECHNVVLKGGKFVYD